MQGQLLVTPEKLISTSQEFSTTGSQITSLTQQMTQLVTALGTGWSGEANVAYTTKFNSLQDDMTRMDSMIKEHVSDLQEMARNYQQAESANVESANALQGDIIS
jgi:WXG100 family type VII secretion target